MKATEEQIQEMVQTTYEKMQNETGFKVDSYISTVVDVFSVSTAYMVLAGTADLLAKDGKEVLPPSLYVR